MKSLTLPKLNNAKLEENFKGFIYKVCQDKNFIMNIGSSTLCSGDLNQYNLDDLNQNDAIIISDNYKNLTRLKIRKPIMQILTSI